MRFVLFIALVTFLGWMFENIIGPWMDLKLLQLRAQREIEQQRQLWRIIEGECQEVAHGEVPCICDWSDYDTLIRDPDCKATDHGLIAWQNERLMSYLHANCPTLPYKFRGK